MDEYEPREDILAILLRAVDIFSLGNVKEAKKEADISIEINCQGTSLLKIDDIEKEKLSDEETAYRMLVDLDVLVCPYCNRAYTFTVWKKYKGKKAIIKSRPQFDHYLPKSLYPYFAISLFNLIPSCSLCNQAKGDSVEKTLYPYSDEFGERIRFQTRGEKNFDYLLGVEAARHKFEVKIVADDMLDEDLKERLENSKKAFHLEELYNDIKIS